jgi:RNA polymerase sigma-70 factor (ECF subfamily)
LAEDRVAWSDAELVRKTLAGDREAFGRLVERHRRTIFALSVQRGFQQSEADDLAQETFVRAFKSLACLQDPEQFARWLYGIAGHVAADAARTRKRRREVGELDDAPELAAEDGAHERVDADRESAQVFQALAELPEEQRLVLTLRYLEELSPKEIAERLGQPRGTVRSRLHHALAFLKQAFGLKVKAGS